ncbi:SEL1-like repeat protein [Methylobacter sp. Wu1]|uniref:SEL1-like repeat protein n=1 Tax=Methylobacter sp. Wu1 TaxID=3119359 RepID=UPI002F91DBA8
MTEKNTLSTSELQQKANDGDAQAQFELALCYANGTDVEKNTEFAFDWHIKAAEQGHVNAQFALGLYYLLGKSRGQHTKQIVEKWLKGFVAGKNVDPAFDLAVSQAMAIEWSGGDDNMAFMWFKKAAEQNHAEANYWLGQCYRNGIGTEQNDGLAFNCFRIAGEQGCAESYYWLARYYFDGKGAEQSDEFALKWIRKSIEHAEVDPEAYLLLGNLYAQSRFVEQSDEQAFHWYEKAAENGVAEAQYRLACCYESGRGVEINIKLADKWFESAGITDIDFQYRMAGYYLQGNGVEKNYEHGMKFMMGAAGEGHVEANNWLTNAYLSLAIPQCLLGKGSDKAFYEFAFNWCTKETLGHHAPEAYLLLGILYFSGKGVEQSDKRAFECFEKAYEIFERTRHDEDRDALTETFIELYLSNCYEQGKGVEKDLNKAKRYFPYDLRRLGQIFMEGITMSSYRTQNAKVFLILLRISIYKFGKKYDLAREFIKEVFKNIGDIDKSFEEICLASIEQEEKITEQKQELEDANHRMQRLVEQFTHSLGNVIFPDTIYQVAERLKNNPECRKDVLLLHEAYHSEVTIKLQGELLRQRYANTSAESFRQLIRRCRRTPDAAESTKSIEDILNYAASRVTARFLNQHYAGLNSIRDKILSKKNASLNALKQKFEDDILLIKSLSPIEWINQNLRPIQITEISPLWRKVFILSESYAEALLFGYFSEILFNAFKYADHDKDEFLTLVFDEKTINDKTYLSCSWKNSVKDKSPTILGTGKGLDAIQEDLKQLNGTENPEESLLVSQQETQFQVTLFFKKDLLVNDLPLLKIKRKSNME